MSFNNLVLMINSVDALHLYKCSDDDDESSASKGTLLKRCQDGDETAWKELFSHWIAKIYRWSIFLGLTPAEAEDASQEVLALAAKRIEMCQNEAVLNSWLYQITRRVAANVRRLKWTQGFVEEEGGWETAFEHDDDKDLEQEMATRSCLKHLPTQEAEILVLMDMEGFTRVEVSKMLRLPPGTVASRLRRGRTLFKKFWRNDARADDDSGDFNLDE